MRAYEQGEYGTPEVATIVDKPLPQPEPDEIIVRVHASSVNPYDWHMMTGTPWLVRVMSGLRRPKDRRMGRDVAGVIAAAGADVTEFSVGDAVFGGANGAYAEFAVAKETSLAPKPANISFEQAAGVGIAAYTALQGLNLTGEIDAGDDVLINGASGGVGTFAIQIAKAAGANVTAVCSTQNLEIARSLGADRVVDYTQADFLDTDTRFDLFFDTVGIRPLLACRGVLKANGRYVAASVPKKMSKIIGRMIRTPLISMLGGRKIKMLSATSKKEDLVLLAEMLESGKVKTVIDRTYSFDQIPEALAYQGEGHAQGKTVITIADAGLEN
ncbi:MAG: NAD(P)-dependent alcohol dehydrogenase [Acidimicrobiia bacterium]|nr:NAD(P)-dependent alcohol dehydrogenase [Acidimicrobiia bacterium]